MIEDHAHETGTNNSVIERNRRTLLRKLRATCLGISIYIMRSIVVFRITNAVLARKRAERSISYKYKQEIKQCLPNSEGGDNTNDLFELGHGCLVRMECQCQEPLYLYCQIKHRRSAPRARIYDLFRNTHPVNVLQAARGYKL
jgi:hypothetical protein